MCVCVLVLFMLWGHRYIQVHCEESLYVKVNPEFKVKFRVSVDDC